MKTVPKIQTINEIRMSVSRDLWLRSFHYFTLASFDHVLVGFFIDTLFTAIPCIFAPNPKCSTYKNGSGSKLLSGFLEYLMLDFQRSVNWLFQTIVRQILRCPKIKTNKCREKYLSIVYLEYNGDKYYFHFSL